MTELKAWIKWVARNADGRLAGYSNPPIEKEEDRWSWDIVGSKEFLNETDDRFAFVKWGDEQPTRVGYQEEEIKMNTEYMGNQVVAQEYLGVEDVLHNFLPNVTDGYVAHLMGQTLTGVLSHKDKSDLDKLINAKETLEMAIAYYEGR